MATVEHHHGSVAELHALDPFADGPPEPQVWWCRPTDAAIVLGSRQSLAVVDADACRRRGLAIVRRRSGGGAVVIRPDAVLWVDVVLPHGVAPDDVRGAMVWVGERWLDAITVAVAPDRRLAGGGVHQGGMVGSAWSDLVCFAGVGPGEVLTPTGKLVGLSQRRTRHGVRVQGLVHRRPLVDDALAVFRPAAGLPSEPLPEPSVLGALDAAAVVAAIASRITPA